MNILITSANSVAAHKLKSKLNADNVIFGDYMDLPEFMVQSGKMIRLPNPASTSYSHEVLTLCLDRSIESIYPLREEEITLLKEAEQLFREYNIEICTL